MSTRLRQLGLLLALFLVAYFLPIGSVRVQGALVEAFAMLHEYAREHVLFCLLPALFIAGGIAVFVSKAAAMQVVTLREIPILQGLLGAGMGKGPALVLLLAGPSLSLPNLLVIGGIMGTRKTIAYASLVVLLATSLGMTYGALAS